MVLKQYNTQAISQDIRHPALYTKNPTMDFAAFNHRNMEQLIWSSATESGACINGGRGINAPLPINTYIEGCVTPPCLLPSLQDAVIHVIFRAPRTIRQMRTFVSANIMGNAWLPWPLDENAETCSFLTNSYCPVLENEVLQYTLKMFMRSLFAIGANPNLEFYVQDSATSSNVFCIGVQVLITDPVVDPSLSARNVTASEIPKA